MLAEIVVPLIAFTTCCVFWFLNYYLFERLW